MDIQVFLRTCYPKVRNFILERIPSSGLSLAQIIPILETALTRCSSNLSEEEISQFKQELLTLYGYNTSEFGIHTGHDFTLKISNTLTCRVHRGNAYQQNTLEFNLGVVDYNHTVQEPSSEYSMQIDLAGYSSYTYSRSRGKSGITQDYTALSKRLDDSKICVSWLKKQLIYNFRSNAFIVKYLPKTSYHLFYWRDTQRIKLFQNLTRIYLLNQYLFKGLFNEFFTTLRDQGIDVPQVSLDEYNVQDVVRYIQNPLWRELGGIFRLGTAKNYPTAYSTLKYQYTKHGPEAFKAKFFGTTSKELQEILFRTNSEFISQFKQSTHLFKYMSDEDIARFLSNLIPLLAQREWMNPDFTYGIWSGLRLIFEKNEISFRSVMYESDFIITRQHLYDLHATRYNSQIDLSFLTLRGYSLTQTLEDYNAYRNLQSLRLRRVLR